MKLVIDIGNTLIKFAVFKHNEIIAIEHAHSFDVNNFEQILNQYPDISCGIVSNVRDEKLNFLFDNQQLQLISFDHNTPIPIENNYKTPETLGKDRIAAAVGAFSLLNNTNILIIDAGTCVTYDMLTAKGVYLGGGISPGISMRLKALHNFTGKLPLIKARWDKEISLIGNNTETSILSGAQHAILCEVDGMIDQYKQQFSDLTIMVTGGDHKYFDKYLKNNIFAAPNLVLKGLKKILDFNEDL